MPKKRRGVSSAASKATARRINSSQTARDRDRLRQQVLEGRGWDIHRVSSTDWFEDRGGQIERLMNLIEQSRHNAKRDTEAERERARLQKKRHRKNGARISRRNFKCRRRCRVVKDAERL